MYNLDALISESEKHPIKLPLQNAEITYYPNFFSKEESNIYFDTFLNEIDWQQDDIKVFGKTYPQPRLTALFGTDGKSYSYSNITMHPLPYTSELLEIQKNIASKTKEKFNTILLNLYRNGRDSNGWHSDDEKELGNNPIIASVSFGAQRYFHFKSKEDSKSTFKLSLSHGSLLLMAGKTQHYWYHQIPKSKSITDPRINLTFRNLVY